VVLAQAKWESAHFKSKVFQENNNLFGMKLARQRNTTAVGENRGHAKYDNWQDSVKDYKLWQDSNGMSNLPKEQYISKLSNIYCPPPDCPKGLYSKNVDHLDNGSFRERKLINNNFKKYNNQELLNNVEYLR
jgi:hypothetical protein